MDDFLKFISDNLALSTIIAIAGLILPLRHLIEILPKPNQDVTKQQLYKVYLPMYQLIKDLDAEWLSESLSSDIVDKIDKIAASNLELVHYDILIAISQVIQMNTDILRINLFFRIESRYIEAKRKLKMPVPSLNSIIQKQKVKKHLWYLLASRLAHYSILIVYLTLVMGWVFPVVYSLFSIIFKQTG